MGKRHPVTRRGLCTWPYEQELGADFVAPVGELTVPPVLLRADQRLTPERFEAVKTDPTFLYRSLAMCEVGTACQHTPPPSPSPSSSPSPIAC